jgi:hypothetical protein
VRSQAVTASDVEYEEVIQNWASADSKVSAGQIEQVVDGEKVVTT